MTISLKAILEVKCGVFLQKLRTPYESDVKKSVINRLDSYESRVFRSRLLYNCWQFEWKSIGPCTEFNWIFKCEKMNLSIDVLSNYTRIIKSIQTSKSSRHCTDLLSI